MTASLNSGYTYGQVVEHSWEKETTNGAKKKNAARKKRFIFALI